MMKSKKYLEYGIFFLAAFFLTVVLGVYKGANYQERHWYKFNIQSQNNQNEIIDLAKQGLLKYYLQPGKISLYGRGIVGIGDYYLHTRVIGMQGYVSQGSKKNKWQEIKVDERLKNNNRGFLPINVELDIPYKDTRNYEVGNMIIELFQNHDQQVIYTMNFKIINSKYLKL